MKLSGEAQKGKTLVRLLLKLRLKYSLSVPPWCLCSHGTWAARCRHLTLISQESVKHWWSVPPQTHHSEYLQLPGEPNALRANALELPTANTSIYECIQLPRGQMCSVQTLYSIPPERIKHRRSFTFALGLGGPTGHWRATRRGGGKTFLKKLSCLHPWILPTVGCSAFLS